MDTKQPATYNIILKEACFRAMDRISTMFFYDKTDADIKTELLTIFPTALILSIIDYKTLLAQKETRRFDEEFKIKTHNAKQHLTKLPNEQTPTE